MLDKIFDQKTRKEQYALDWLGRVESKRKAGEGASALHIGETFGLSHCLA